MIDKLPHIVRGRILLWPQLLLVKMVRDIVKTRRRGENVVNIGKLNKFTYI